MNWVRLRRPSPSLVISLLALFVALGGTGYAAIKLPKNSVGAKQLQKNAVTGAKVKNQSLTGADLKLSTLGTVPSATNAGHAGTADSATTAANATHADAANTATSATHAADAATVAGMTVKGFTYQAPSNGGPATLFSLNGLTLTATCSSGNISAQTSVDNAYISAGWVTGANSTERATDKDFDSTETFASTTNTGARTGSIEYVRPDGKRVSVSLQAEMTTNCTVSGHAFASG